jgi:ferredoxin
MATRKIIEIDEDLCNGCGECITSCAEGALALVDGKARLVKEQFCDGFGACIGECPTGALKIVERDADEFNFNATKEHVMKEQGQEAAKHMEQSFKAHVSEHQPKTHSPMPASGGCPGTAMRFAPKSKAAATPAAGAGPGKMIPSELEQWPIQIHLVRPDAPFFKNRELAVLSTCAPIASADVHWRFIRGRGIVVGCPKLDQTEGYVEKLAAILSEPTIPKVIIVRMEVPCCGGLSMIVEEAAQASGRTDLVVEEVTVGLDGTVLDTRQM